MINCPDEYYNNCANRIKKCKRCLCGEGTKYNQCHYLAIDPALPMHPYQVEQLKLKTEEIKAKKSTATYKANSKRVKAGYKQEDQLLKKTLRSGAVHGDGDLKALNGIVQIDSKLRTKGASFTVTKAEYEKAIAQGTNAFVITLQEVNRQGVFLTYELFVKLLELAELKL